MNLQTMPHIPSPTELGFKTWGRGGDTEAAHVAPGEHIVPPEVIAQYPELGQAIAKAISSMGRDPRDFIVGSGRESINPDTGQPEFGLFSSIKKVVKKVVGAVKNVVKKVASSPILRTVATVAASFVPGIGPVLAPLVSAGLTKSSGGSWGQAIGAGAGTFLGSQIGTGLFGQGVVSAAGPTIPTAGLIGSGGQVFGASTVGQLLGSGAGKLLPAALANTALSTAVGGMVGNSIGTSVGAMIDPPKVQSWGNQMANDPTSAPAPQLPGAQTPPVAIPLNNQAPNAPTPVAAPEALPAGVSYLTSSRDRFTGQDSWSATSGSFGSNFLNNRRSGWGNNVSFA